jgi:amino acid adenylation domain-containing protein
VTPPGLRPTAPLVSANQRALWFLHQLAPDGVAYNMAFTGPLRPDVDPQRLELAYRRVVTRHRALRTGYRQKGGVVEAHLFPAERAEFRLAVSAPASTEEAEREAETWFAELADQPFALDDGRVCRLGLLRQTGATPGAHLAVVAHHIAGDHYAIERFVEALAAAYERGEAEAATAADDDGYDYADWCAEQARHLESPRGRDSLEVWTSLLSPLPPPLDLPTDHPRPDAPSFTGAERVFVWDADRSDRIAATAAALKTTPYVVLLSAFQLFLERLSGQSRFVVGSPVMGRSSAQHRRVIGYCANPLLLPIDMAAQSDFAGHVAHNHALRRRLIRHERVPVAAVLDRLDLPRDRGRIAVAPCMFTFTRHHDRKFAQSLELGYRAAGQRGAAHDLNLVVNDRDGAYVAHWRYSDALFRPETVDAIAADFDSLVDALCAAPSAPYATLTVPGWTARAVAGHDGESDAAPPDTALARLLHQPDDAPAVLDGDGILTHGAVRRQAAALADRIGSAQNETDRAERCVGLLLPRDARQIVGMVACWLAKAAFLPLDRSHPADRLARATAACDAVVGMGARPDWLPSGCLWIDGAAPEESGGPGALAIPTIPILHPHHTAYRLQTSGSTGAAKTVAVGHGALAAYARAVWDRLALPPGAVCASLAAPSTDLGYTSLFGALLNGGRLRVLDEALALDGVALAEQLARHPVDVLKIVPSHLAALLAIGGPGLLPRHTLVLGGESPSPALLDRLRDLRPDLRIVNHYGPTETTVGVAADALRLGGPVALGRALDGNRLHVLDDALRSCPSGAIGVLHVAGAQVALGYHARPTDTAASFLPDPFSPTPGGRLYRTGDRVRRIGDQFQFLGRADGQVKIRGHRVELAEVESHLQAAPGVVEAAAILVERDGHRQIAAFLTGGADMDAARGFLRDRLPAAMTPDHWRVIDRLPRAANGKIDRQALARRFAEATAPHPASEPATNPAPAAVIEPLRRIWQATLRRAEIGDDQGFFTLGGDSILALQSVAAARRAGIVFTVQDLFRAPTLSGLAALIAEAAPAQAPENPLLETLRVVWGAVLRRDRVADADHFFALGGDSILALQMVAECRRRGVTVTPQDLFAHPRLDALARLLAERAPQAVAPPSAPVAPEEPLSTLLGPMQRWFFATQPDHPNHWNQSLRLRADRWPPPADLERALAWALARHPMLTTLYRREDSGWRLAPPARPAPPILDHRRCADEAEEITLCRAAERSLSITHGPILRALLLERADAPDGGALFLTAHHLAVDGVSWRVLLGDVQHACARLARGEPLPAAIPDPRYRRWATEQAHALARVEVSSARAHADAIRARRPEALERRPDVNAPTQLERRAVALDPVATAALLRASTDEPRATVHHRVLAAWLAAWRDATGRDWALVDVEEHGRDERMGDCVGWFTARFPVLFDRLPRDPDRIADAVRRTLDAVPAPLRGQGAALAADGVLPTAECCVNYLGVLDGGLSGDGLSDGDDEGGIAGLRLDSWPLDSLRAPGSRSVNGVTVDAWVTEGRLTASLAFQGGRYDESFQERLTAAFREALRRHDDADGARIAARIPADEIEAVWPLTAAQRGILFQCLLEGRRDLYLNATVLEIGGPLDADRLRAAWDAVRRRHAITRAHAMWDGLDQPRLVIRANVIRTEVADALRVIDVTDGDDGDAALDALIAGEKSAGFDLAAAPLMRFTLARRPNGRGWLIWTRHHLVVDGWTSALLLEELLATYAGQAPTRAVPPMTRYFEWLERRPMDAALAIWRDHLAGLAPPDAPPPAPSGDGEAVALEWWAGPTLLHGLRERAGRAGVTLGTLLQFAWAAAIGAQRGRDDVVIGVTVAGRPADLPDAERMTGVFINSVPLRARLRAAEPIEDGLRRLQDDAAPLRAAPFTPLADIQRAAGFDATRPLFDTLLVLENYPLPAIAGTALPTIALRRADERSHFPVTLQLTPGDDLIALCRINPDRCDQRDAAALFERFQAMLPLLAAASAEAPSTLDALARRSAPHALWRGASGPSVPADPGWWVGQAILDQSARAPDALALETSVGPMSYGALTRSALALARGLRKRGVGPEDRVALRLERGPALIVALLGVLFSGAAYVPLDPAQPESRLADILDQANPRLILAPANSGQSGQTQSGGAETVSPDALIRDALIHDGRETEGDGWLPAIPHPEQTAYVIFTSGSTGRPKGVAVRHAGLSNLLRAMADVTPLTSADRWLAVTTIGFDIAALEIFAPLIAGAAVVLADEIAQRDPAALLRLLDRHRVTVLQVTPASWAMLAELDSPAWVGLRALTGGEALPAALAERLLRRGARLTNVYGPTETTIWSSAAPVETVADGQSAVPIGGPLDNTNLYVLDAALNPLPPGAEGELWIGGDGLARGYHARPGLTASAFLPDPFVTRPGARMYRTGDLVRRGWDGALRFVGRRDFQVKLRGHRIELGEIEAALLAQPGVAAAAVRLWDAGTDAAFLAAYAAGSGLDPEALRRGLADRLPAAMIPANLLTLDALPLNPNGKIDRNALPRPGRPAAANRRPPQGDAEQWLAALWQDLLDVQDVARDDDFFALGGNSLTATRLVAAVRREFGDELPLAALFGNPTIAALAARLPSAGRRQRGDALALMADLLTDLE